jgi:lipopolysaccharide biosynthesis glycosyltransferase
MKEKIHVVFSPDENYAIYAGVAMTSILYHASDPGRFHFYFLQGDRRLSDASRAKLDRAVKKYGAAMSFLEVDVSLIAGFAHLGTKRIMKRISAAAYYRLLIPDLLKDLERCIYLDCDVIALGDLAELWDTINPNTSVAAVCDCYIHGTGMKKFEVIKCYFNSGVLLMNLRLWRERGHVKSCLQLSADPKMHERFADQDVLNVNFCDDVHILHPRWNIQVGHRHWSSIKGLDSEWREILESPKIAHFASACKPWKMAMKHHWSMEYWRMLARTPWGEEMPGLRKKMMLARCKRFQAQLSRALRWTVEISMDSKRGTCRVILFGRLLLDKTPRRITNSSGHQV